MKKLLILLTLFPFLHATSYTATYVSCDSDAIVLKLQGQDTQVSLFNVKVKEQGWSTTCELLSKAEKLHIEIDPSSAVQEPLPVYIFADGELVQEELLKKQQAIIQIRNPEYTYEDQMEKASSTTSVMAPAITPTKRAHAKNAPLLLGTLIILWLGMLTAILHRRNHKKTKKIFKKKK